MALGGGTFTAQNKVLPGVYINVNTMSAQTGNSSSRGVVAVPIPLNWGVANKIISVTADEFRKNSLKLFGYSYDSPQMIALRELFRGASLAYVYRVASADAVCASNDFATATYPGTRGNDIKIAIVADVDNENKLKVSTYLGTELVDSQIVTSAAELKANAFVTFKSDATLTATAATSLANGSDGSPVTVADYQSFLDATEPYSFNVLCCPTSNAEVCSLFTAFVKRMREERGARYQVVAYRTAADYEGVVNVKNSASGFAESIPGMGAYGLVYWIAGITAGCELNRSNTNREYDGELTIDVKYTQLELERCVKNGEFVLHNVSNVVRVLEDFNSLTTFTDNHGEALRHNQVIRAVDQLAIDIAVMFNNDYHGKIGNTASGRMSFWNDVCKIIQKYVNDGVYTDFTTDLVEVNAGEDPRSVACNINGLTHVYTMARLYLGLYIF